MIQWPFVSRREYEAMEASQKYWRGEYKKIKHELQKYQRKRDKNGRFIKS